MNQSYPRLDEDLEQVPLAQKFVTFRKCKELAGINGKYQQQLFLTMSFYWIAASFFLGLPFFLFKKPIFTDCQNEFNHECMKKVCQNFKNDIIKLKQHIRIENSFTYQFNLFCELEPLRVIYKISPQVLSLIGLLIYGSIADSKGRVVAFKISWRFYTIGLVILTFTRTQFLITFGYIFACVNCFPSLVIQFILLFEQASRYTRVKASMILLSTLVIGPLILSLNLQYILSQIGIRATLAIFGAIPSFILSITINQVNQSAFFLYQHNKAMAFNVLNIIATINQVPPILVDLGNSSWVKHRDLRVPLLRLFNIHTLRINLIIGIIMITSIQFNMKSAQISLDYVTNSYLRSILMALSSSSADLTLCFIFLTMKRTIRRILSLSMLLVLVRMMVTLQAGGEYSNIQIFLVALVAMGGRYLNEMCYGMMLIWCIEIFPTISRGRCCSMVLGGLALGSILAYSLKEEWLVWVTVQLVLTAATIYLERYINLNVEGNLYDTLANLKYDRDDRFYIL